MSSITKNYLDEDTIRKITEQAFGKGSLRAYEGLEGGFCNAVYRIKRKEGSDAILKVAPADHIRLMSCETEMMRTEVGAMRLAGERKIPGVPAVYASDESRSICTGVYLLMEKKEGVSLAEAKQQMDERQKEQADLELGKLLRQINSIEGERFGHFCVEELQSENWFDAFYRMISRVIDDGIEADISIGVSYRTILDRLKEQSWAFAEVTAPRLIHFDSWDGNFLVKDQKISGIIDWERAMWAEGLMEDRFRFHSVSDAFLKGYGKENFTPAEKIRCRWYDVYLYLIMMFEGTYRHYETQDQYNWVHGLFVQVWKEIDE